MNAGAATTSAPARPEASCPLRPGDPCRLCVPGATGPLDCGLVYLVMQDPGLRAALQDRPASQRRRA